MTYNTSNSLCQKRLTKEQRVVTIKELKQKFAKIWKEVDESPCYYRGCELWSDCKTCKGFKDGCSARFPERLLKDSRGNWIDPDP